MKKTLLLLLLFSAKLATAQLYISPSYAYSLPVMKHVIAEDFLPDPHGYWVYNMYGSFGGGNAFGGTAGYRFGNGLVIEFSAESFRSGVLTSELRDSVDPSYDVTVRREASLRMMRWTPKIGYAVTRNKFTLSMTGGAVIGTGLNVFMQYSETSDNPSGPSDVIEKDENHFGNISVGFHSAVALNYRFYKGFYTALEVTGNFQSWKPREGELVRYEANGVDQMASASYAYSHFVFEDGYSSYPLPVSDEPHKRQGPVYSLGGIGVKLSVGVELRMGTKSGKLI